MPTRATLFLLLCSCVAPRAPQDPPPGWSGAGRPAPASWDQPQRQQSGQGRWGTRAPVDVVAMPVTWLEADTDGDQPPSTRSDRFDGPGGALRAAIGNDDQSIGLLYQAAGLSHSDEAFDLDLHALYLDFDVSVPMQREPEGFHWHAAAGIGFAALDYDGGTWSDATTGAANLRLDIEFRPAAAFSLLFGGGGFVFGHPGETEAYGGFFELGGRIHF